MKITSEDLKEGEVICNKCEGGGSWPQLFLKEEQAQYYRCPKCRGRGKLDWIHNITGVPPALGDLFVLPHLRKQCPKLLASELMSVQPMGKPEIVKIFIKRRTTWRRAVTYLRDSKPLQRLLTIFSKEKEEDGTKTSQENTSPLF